MVRRPAAVLTRLRAGPGTLAVGAPLLALAYFLTAPALPALPAGDTTIAVAGGVGLIMVAASTLAILPAYETLLGPLFIAFGSGLLVAALAAAGVGAGANFAEAMFAAAAGLLLARWLATPSIAVAVPLFVAAIDVYSVVSETSSQLLEESTDSVDALSFDLPAWGGSGSAGHLALSDAVFVSMFSAWAFRYGFRRAATVVVVTVALVASLVLGLVLDRAIPALPLVAAGYLVVNVDRAVALLRDSKAPV